MDYKNNLKHQHLSWKDDYLNVKNDIEKTRKQFIYNFNILSDYSDEWDNLQSQVQEQTKKHEIDQWENIIIDEIDLHTSNPKLNMLTNTKEVELYDLTYEYSSTLK